MFQYILATVYSIIQELIYLSLTWILCGESIIIITILQNKKERYRKCA